MSAEQENVTARQAVENILASRATTEPGFIAKAMLDPKGVVGPIVTDVLDDDGEIDLTEVAINVHVQTDSSLHFVLATDAEDDDEAAGFARIGGGFRGGISNALSFQVINMPTLGAKDGTTIADKSVTTTDANCSSDCCSSASNC